MSPGDLAEYTGMIPDDLLNMRDQLPQLAAWLDDCIRAAEWVRSMFPNIPIEGTGDRKEPQR